MTTVNSMLARYLKEFPNIPGFFTPESMAVWEFLLGAQDELRVRGDFLEIGVYKGRSAALGALHLRPEESCVLIDINSVDDVARMIRSFHPANNITLQCYSAEAFHHPEVRNRAGKFRWLHVDGDHTGYSTLQDIRLAESVMSPAGIICVDDFFNFRYPQLTAAVYRFLFERSIDFRMLLCAENKCYICRAGAYAMYERLIRARFAPVCVKNKRQLNKTSYSSDWGCFSMSWHEGGPDIQGIDTNPSEIVY